MEEENKINMKEVYIDLPGRRLTFRVAEDIEALITDINDEDKVPCWADIWPASYGMAYFIWDKLQFSPGEKVLELGAGMGLPGITCALKGAALTLSDFNPTALEMAAQNASLNGVAAELLQEDWRCFGTTSTYDYILASDILYDPKLNPFLGQIFRQNLKPGGKVLISHPQRKATMDFLEEWLNPSLFYREDFSRDVELTGTLLPVYRIAINCLTRLPSQ